MLSLSLKKKRLGTPSKSICFAPMDGRRAMSEENMGIERGQGTHGRTSECVAHHWQGDEMILVLVMRKMRTIGNQVLAGCNPASAQAPPENWL